LQRLTAAPGRLRYWLMRFDRRRPGRSSALLPPVACVAVARWAPKAVMAARSVRLCGALREGHGCGKDRQLRGTVCSGSPLPQGVCGTG